MVASIQQSDTHASAKPKMARVYNVQIFAAGKYRGRDYTVQDLDEIVRNFYRLGPRGLKLLQPPSVIGHEETQEFLERTDLPAAGWLKQLRRQGDILVGDFGEVPESIAKLINSRAYRKVSAEIYDDFKDDQERGYGKAIRRVALLGGEIPQVKRLEDIPLAKFNDKAGRAKMPLSLRREVAVYSKSRGTVIVFAEIVPMNRDQLVAAIKAAMPNLSQTTIDSMTDEMLQDMVSNLPGGSTPVASMAEMSREELINELTALGQDPATLEPMTDEQLAQMYDELAEDDEPVADMGEGDTASMPREEMIAALVAQGQDAASLETLTDEELANMLKQPNAQMADDKSKKTPAKPATKPFVPRPKMLARSSPKIGYSVQAMSDSIKKGQREIAQLRAQMKAQSEQLKAEKLKAKHEIVEAFCDRLVSEGRLLPAVKRAVIAELVAANDSTIQNFTEGGKKVAMTAFEKLKAEYASAPKVIHFGEKLKGSPKAEEERELAAVERFAQIYGESIKKAGKKPEEYVAKFSELRKKQPSLTAAEYGVPAECYS